MTRLDGVRSGPDPLIVTALFDAASTAFFQDLRTRHFPPALNIVPAHLTLFHHLPGSELPTVLADIQAVCVRQGAFVFTVSGARSLGRGAAFGIHAPELGSMRQRLALMWDEWLTPQDRQGFRPHVTVQNKVPPEDARRLLLELESKPTPIAGSIVGLALWHYRGGPWELAGQALLHA